MNFRQWEIWKDKATDHWFVLISPPEREIAKDCPLEIVQVRGRIFA
jgi:hypothetical protein